MNGNFNKEHVNLMVDKFNSNQKWKNDICRCEYKSIICLKNITFEILLHVVAKWSILNKYY